MTFSHGGRVHLRNCRSFDIKAIYAARGGERIRDSALGRHAYSTYEVVPVSPSGHTLGISLRYRRINEREKGAREEAHAERKMFRGVNDKRRETSRKGQRKRTRKPKRQFFRKKKIKERERKRN